MEGASLPKRFPRPAGNPSASDPGWGSAHPDSNSMPSPGRWGGHVPLMGGPWLGLQLMRQGYHLDMGCPLSASRVCGVSGESVQTFLSRHGVTTGSQQCLDFAGKLFLDPGDVVLCESPSYLGALNAFNAYEPTFVEVPTDNVGLIPEELDKILSTTDRCKFIYVIPDFQNPTGRTWSLERRKKFMEVVNKHNLPVLEDNPYGELRYEGEILPSLKSMDTKGLVMFLGTFSKIFCPGLRLGWVAASKDVVSEYVKIKQSADLHTSNFDQGIADAYMENYDLDKHVEEIKALYKKRRDLILKTMAEEFPAGTEWTHPEGGLFLWLTFPQGCSADKVFHKCIEMKVAGVTGDAFYPNGKTDRNMRINFSNMPEEKIIEGVKRMAKAIRECM